MNDQQKLSHLQELVEVWKERRDDADDHRVWNALDTVIGEMENALLACFPPSLS